MCKCKDREPCQHELEEQSKALQKKILINALLKHACKSFGTLVLLYYLLGRVQKSINFSFLRTFIFATVTAIAGIRAYNSKAEHHLRQLSAAERERIFAGRDNSSWERFNNKEFKDRASRTLSEAIKAKTISYDRDDPDNKIDYAEFLKLHEIIRNSFPLVHQKLNRYVVNNYSLIYVWPGRDESQEPYMIYGHLDVVPTPEAKKGNWSVDPFEGKIAPGIFNKKNQLCVWGRGAIDDKQACFGMSLRLNQSNNPFGTTAYLEALEDLIKSGFEPCRSLYLCMGHDEEISGHQGAKEIARYLKETLKVNSFEFVCDEGLFVISDALIGHEKPVALISTAEKGSATFKLSVKAIPGHSSTPPIEGGCIGVLAKAVKRLEDNPHPAYCDSSVVGDMFSSIQEGMILPLRILFSNYWLFRKLIEVFLGSSRNTQPLVRTTTAVTVFKSGLKTNALPGEAIAYVNHRIHPNDSVETVLERDRQIINDPRVRFTVVSSLKAAPVSPSDAPAFQDLKETTHEFYPDVAVAPCLFIGNTDSKSFWDFTNQIFRYNPIALHASETKMFHGIDERIAVDTYITLIAFWRSMILKSDNRSVPTRQKK